MGDLMEMNPPEQDQRYAVYSVRNTAEDGLIYTRSFIVIKNGYGVIVRFTRLQEYAGVYVNGTYRPLTSNPEAKLYFICGMLNYCLVDHGARFGIRHVFSITRRCWQSTLTITQWSSSRTDPTTAARAWNGVFQP